MSIAEAAEYTQVLIDRTQIELIKAISINSLDVGRLDKEFNYYLLVQELLEDLYR